MRWRRLQIAPEFAAMWSSSKYRLEYMLDISDDELMLNFMATGLMRMKLLKAGLWSS